MVFGIKRRRSPEKMMSHSQPVSHVQTKENYKIQYKKQKALVLKHTKEIDRTIQLLRKQTKILQDIVNN